MTATKDKMMTNDAARPNAVALVGWPLAIIFGSAMLLGGFAGYDQAMLESGDARLPAWVGPLVALAFGIGGFALYFRRYAATWRQWSPRKRRYWFAIAFCAVVGGIVGGWMVTDQPDAGGPISAMTSGALSPGFAIGASLLWFGGLAIGMILYHRSIDDHEERAWLWACVAGWYAFIFPAPIWWVLYRASLAPPVDVMVLFALSLIVNAIVWLWLKYR